MSAVKLALKLAIALLLTPTLALAQQPDGSFSSPFRFGEPTGEAIYQNICAGCHMPDGRGATGAGAYPSLRQNPRLAATDYDIAIITRSQKAMPGFSRTLTERQIADVADYISKTFNTPLPESPK